MIKSFVSFYRQNGKPSFTSGSMVEISCICNKENLVSIKEIQDSGIEIEQILLNDSDVEIDDILESNDTLDVSLSIPTNGLFHIYDSVSDMLDKAKSLSAGEFLNEFYIIEDDYYSQDTVAMPNKYQNLFNICSLIKGLGELAHYHDTKDRKGDGNSFVFIDESELIAAKPIIIQPVISLEMLDLEVIDVTLVESFYNASSKSGPSVGKEKGLFRVSIIEFFGSLKYLSHTEMFSHLVMKWNDFLDMYQRNLDTYISGFAFHKVRKEVAAAEFSISDQYSKVIGDIAGKLFGLPVSFVVVLGLFQDKITLPVELIVLLALYTASWLMSKLVLNQLKQLDRINHAKGISFDSLEGEQVDYPKDLQDKLTEAITALDNNYESLKNSLERLNYMIWLPFITAFLIVLYRYIDVIWIKVNSILNYLI
ncbi:TPA: hypothetical protein ACX6SS_002219 [Photobacterium damselae]|uniref:hypothetical protein n=1 Tax=Photobacterium damselae TaxID=38293 RepID=UPI0020CC85E7|nr:hypothetical protein [Photobacterium damselae]